MWGAQAGGLWSLCSGMGKGALVALCHCVSKAFHILNTVHALLGLSFPFKEMQLVLSPCPKTSFYLLLHMLHPHVIYNKQYV